MRLIDDWHSKLLRLHSMRAAIGGAAFWSMVGGAIMVWPALADKIPVGAYVIGGIVLSAAFGVARLLKQPGAE
ncbi:hypothetical protein HAP41_0000033345 [Bradyrhizobium barranii subsp. apii]|uniref:Uncharacterized protein n=1 Tax=Bradyrhizobium barranii subsp. apii TaxID=2819348 RepID=A0A8T5VGE1_9BRAD|nr:hypothetical protein [Bradyrhizobium barranii]UPT85176.1 hypothetical protein HAP41_0000033345 [Bradyrhizobium barranii subsp. apii]